MSESRKKQLQKDIVDLEIKKEKLDGNIDDLIRQESKLSQKRDTLKSNVGIIETNYFNTKKIFNKRLDNVNNNIVIAKNELRDLERKIEEEISLLNQKKKILTSENDDLVANVLLLSEEESERKKENDSLDVAIRSNKKDLELINKKVETAKALLLEKKDEIKQLDSKIANLEKEKETEIGNVEKLVKKQFTTAQRELELKPLEVEIREAYKRAGVPYPYD